MAPTKTSLKLIAAGLLCVVAWLIYWLTCDPPPLRDRDTDRDSPRATMASAAAATQEEATQREAMPTADAPAVWLDHPFVLELEVLVVDPNGLPVMGHTLSLAPPSCTLNDAPKATGPDGRLSLSWRSRQPNGEVVLADERNTLRRVSVRHGTRTKLALPGLVRPDGGRILRGKGGGVLGPESAKPGTLFNAHVGERPDVRTGLHPHAVFGTAAAGVGARSDTFGVGSEMMIPDSWFAATTAAPSGIAGTVFGEDGRPAARAPIVLLLVPGANTPPAALPNYQQPVRRAKTDGAGQFAFAGLAAGEFTVRAGGTAAGLATCPAITTTGTTPVTLNLHRDSCVRGRVVSAAGQPLAQATIVWRADDGSWCDSTESSGDGTFVLANLPVNAGTVLMWAPGSKHTLPVAMVSNVLNDAGELSLQCNVEATGALRLEPVLPEGIVAASLTVRVWSEDTGTGTLMWWPGEGKPWRLANLAAGWYRIELHTAATGWFDAGRHWVDGKGDCDLGRVALPSPSTVKFAFAPHSLPGNEEQAFEVCALRTDVDVRVEANRFVPEPGLLLPTGDYVLVWKDKGGAKRFHRFTACGGKTVVVAPGP